MKRSKLDACFYYRNHKVAPVHSTYGYCWKVYDLKTGEHFMPVGTVEQAKQIIEMRTKQ